MATKELKARVTMKHDTETNWNKAINFTPLNGEVIVYDMDATNDKPRIKIGDGLTKVTELPFASGSELPDVTSTDDGKVLGVVNGDWGAIDPPSGGTSDYNELTNSPMRLSAPRFTQDDSIGTGMFMGQAVTKISNGTYSLSAIIGGTVTANGTELAINTTRAQDLTSVVGGYGYTGNYFAVVSVSGTVTNFDFVVIMLDQDFTMSAMGTSLTAGTYIASAVTELLFPESVVINEKYAANLLPAVTSGDTGKEMKAIGGKFALGAKSSITGANSLRNIRRQLFRNLGYTAAPAWSQIRLYNSDLGEIVSDVVHYNTGNNSLTVLMSDMVSGYEFDASEALFYCPSGLAVGTYYYDATNEDYVKSEDKKVISFTLTQDIPANGQLALSLDLMDWHIGTTVSSYASASSTEPIETVDIVDGDSGTDIKTVLDSGCFNSYARAIYGSANYGQSGIFKWLNGTGQNWWTPSTPWDRPPSYVNKPGFLTGFDQETLDALADVEVTVATNSTFEYGYSTDSTYTVTGKFHLPSLTELCGDTTNNGTYEGTQFDAFSDFNQVYNAQNEYEPLIKYAAGMPWWWWERSCVSDDPSLARVVIQDGLPSKLHNTACDPTRGFAAACVIKPIYPVSE